MNRPDALNVQQYVTRTIFITLSSAGSLLLLGNWLIVKYVSALPLVVSVFGLLLGLLLGGTAILLCQCTRPVTQTLMDIGSVLTDVDQGIYGRLVVCAGTGDLASIIAAVNTLLVRIESHEQRFTDKTNELQTALDQSVATIAYKNQVLARVCHEMKTPLQALGNYLELIGEALPTGNNEPVRHFHGRALARADDLSTFIQSLLLHGKLDAQQIAVSRHPVALKPLMMACAEKLTLALEKNRNTLVLEGHDSVLHSDADLLSHIVTNLLSNACKFTLDGQLKLRWQQEASDLIIEVSDTGCGIPQDYHAHLFEAYWQGDQPLQQKRYGTGLGLAITKQCVDQLGGHITVVSAVAKGSVFTVSLPI